MLSELQKNENLNYIIGNIFSELKIIYEQVFDVAQEDKEDLFYLIDIPTKGELEVIKKILGIIYLHISDNSINLLVPNIYKMETEENVKLIYDAINEVNSSALIGKFFFMGETEKQIVYKSYLNCGEEFSELTVELVEKQLERFMMDISKLFRLIGKRDESR